MNAARKDGKGERKPSVAGLTQFILFIPNPRGIQPEPPPTDGVKLRRERRRKIILDSMKCPPHTHNAKWNQTNDIKSIASAFYARFGLIVLLLFPCANVFERIFILPFNYSTSFRACASGICIIVTQYHPPSASCDSQINIIHPTSPNLAVKMCNEHIDAILKICINNRGMSYSQKRN